ncbi:MAG: hypothetical protein HYX41_00850 [Bdellovibrio sp.]|nr:hypothetical protein [Bdellovibrio sp.]
MIHSSFTDEFPKDILILELQNRILETMNATQPVNNPKSTETSDQWLIRTADNWLAGPYLKDQVRKMVLEGKLTLQDEICPANGYWIFLHEYSEVQSALGVQVPKANSGDEVTETQIPTSTKKEKSAGSDPAAAPNQGKSPPAEQEKTITGTIVRKSIFEPLLEHVQAQNAKKSNGASEGQAQIQVGPPQREAEEENPNAPPHKGGKAIVWLIGFAGIFLAWVIVRMVFNR